MTIAKMHAWPLERDPPFAKVRISSQRQKTFFQVNETSGCISFTGRRFMIGVYLGFSSPRG